MAESLLNNSGFECYICLELMDGEIVLCESGHSCCRRCSCKMRHCGICEKPINGESRNFTMEKVIRDMIKTTQLDEHELHVQSSGIPTKLNNTMSNCPQLNEHEVHVPNSSIPNKNSFLRCPEAKCIFFNDNLLQHMEDMHQGLMRSFDFESTISYGITMTAKKDQFYLKPIFNFGKRIIFVVKIKQKFEKVYINIRHIAETPPNRNYTFSFRRQNGEIEIQPYKYKFGQSPESFVNFKFRIRKLNLNFSIHQYFK